MLGTAVEERTEIVTDGASEYTFVGRPDANLMAGTLLLPENECAIKAILWKRLYGTEFDPRMVKHILVVTATIQPVEGENPYDETEIAEFASKHGPTFLKMMAAAYRVLGITDSDDAFDKVAAGNSSDAPDLNSRSTSGASTESVDHAEGS